MKNQHKDFPSDIFLTLSVCDADVVLGDTLTEAFTKVKAIEFHKANLSNKIVVKVEIPAIPAGTFVSR